MGARAFDAALRNAFTLSKRWLARHRRDEKPRPRHRRADNRRGQRIDIRLNRAKIAAALEAGEGSQRPDIEPITLSIEAKLRRAGKGKRLVIANGAEAEVNAGLVELIKDAFTIQIQLLSGSDDGVEAMSGRLGMNKCRLTSLIRLSYLAPDIVRVLLEGRQPMSSRRPTLATEQGPAARLERTATCSRLRRLNLHQNPGETLHIRHSKTALRGPCGRSAPHPGFRVSG